jgi:mRNA-degrading endonuclease toxin of MazEF toxin-antitoxin module
MIGEIWYYKAKLPNSNEYKARPILIIGTDEINNLLYIDIHYVLISSSADKGDFDVSIDSITAKEIGLTRASIIKTTKIYTGSKSLLERKVCDLPNGIYDEFLSKYKSYQDSIINLLESLKYIEQM